MIFTCNFAKFKKYSDMDGVNIAVGKPDWWHGESLPELMPPWDLVDSYKNGVVEDIVYEQIYIQRVLSRLDPHVIAKKMLNKVMLCYCSDFCHRHIVAKWLSEHGYVVKELT